MYTNLTSFWSLNHLNHRQRSLVHLIFPTPTHNLFYCNTSDDSKIQSDPNKKTYRKYIVTQSQCNLKIEKLLSKVHQKVMHEHAIENEIVQGIISNCYQLLVYEKRKPNLIYWGLMKLNLKGLGFTWRLVIKTNFNSIKTKCSMAAIQKSFAG